MNIFATSREHWRTLLSYLSGERSVRRIAVTDPATLIEFLNGRASHVAQTSLYGYLRTRAGMRYPELFENDDFLVAVNIAKWQVWLACLSDLAVFSGGLIKRATDAPNEEVGALMSAATGAILDEIGIPEEAGDGFHASRERLRERVAATEWSIIGDDESAFAESSDALVRWAPIVDDLKALDEGIVRNSVRFRWQEVRRDLRGGLDAAALLTAFRTRLKPDGGAA